MLKWFWRDSINRWLTATFIVSLFISVKSSSTACVISHDFICSVLVNDGTWFNDYTFGLSLSVIAGFIVWWLSVVWPMHKKRVLLKNLLLESYDRALNHLKAYFIEDVERYLYIHFNYGYLRIKESDINLGEDFQKYASSKTDEFVKKNIFRGNLQSDEQLYNCIAYELIQLEKTIHYVFSQLPDAEKQSLDLFVVFSQEIDQILRSPNSLLEKEKHLERFVFELLSWRSTTDNKPYYQYDQIRRKIENI